MLLSSELGPATADLRGASLFSADFFDPLFTLPFFGPRVDCFLGPSPLERRPVLEVRPVFTLFNGVDFPGLAVWPLAQPKIRKPAIFWLSSVYVGSAGCGMVRTGPAKQAACCPPPAG